MSGTSEKIWYASISIPLSGKISYPTGFSALCLLARSSRRNSDDVATTFAEPVHVLCSILRVSGTSGALSPRKLRSCGVLAFSGTSIWCV